MIGAVAALDSVVAVATPERIVTDAADDRIVAVRAADDDVIAPRVLHEEILVHNDYVGRRKSRVADHERKQIRLGFGIRVGLLGKVDFQKVVRPGEDVEMQAAPAELTQIGVAHAEGRERVRLQLAEEMDVGRAPYVVEAIAVLQPFQLRLEDVVLGRAKIATERHSLFGQAAVPEVDVVEARSRHAAGTALPRAHAVQKVHGVRRSRGHILRRTHETGGRAISPRVTGKRADDGAGRRTPVCEGGYRVIPVAHDAVRTCE